MAFGQESASIRQLIGDTVKLETYYVPVTSISTASEETTQILQEIRRNLVSPEELRNVDERLREISHIVDSLSNQLTDAFLSQSSMLLIDKYQVEVEQDLEYINNYDQLIQNEINQLENYNRTIDKLRIIWDQTNSEERIADLSQTVKDIVQELIQTIDQTKEKVNQKVNVYLEWQIELNQHRSDLQGILNRIRIAEADAGKNILIPESKPFVALYRDSKVDTVDHMTWQELILLRKEEVGRYYELHKYRIFLTIVLIIIIQFLFYGLKEQVQKIELGSEERNRNFALHIIKRNVSTGLIVGLLITSALLPGRSLIINNILYTLSLAPLFILFNAVLDRRYFHHSIFLGIIFFATLFSDSFLEIKLLKRTVFLVISIATIVWLMMILVRNRKLRVEASFIQKLSTIFASVFMVLAFIALLANFTGNFRLVILIMYGIVGSIFGALIIYISYQILMGISIVVLKIKNIRERRIFSQYGDTIITRLSNILKTIAYVLYFFLVLRSFRINDDVVAYVNSILSKEINLGDFSFTLANILLFILVLLVARWISKFVRFILGEQVFLKSDQQKDIGASISSLVSFTIMTIGFIVAVLAVGFEIDKLTILLSAFGVGIGFGLQDIFNNLVSGIIIVFERPLQVGDTIEVGNLIGTVKNIGIRSSVVRTFDGSEVIVPNGNLISKELINWTHSDQQRRMIINVGVEYGTDPEKVIEILTKVAENNKKVISWPKPYVLFKEFGDSSLNFELRCWTDDYDNWIFIASELHVKVNNALNKAGIVIPFPQRDIHIREGDGSKK